MKICRGAVGPLSRSGLSRSTSLFFSERMGRSTSRGRNWAEVKIHLVLLAAAHPELKIPEKAQEFITYEQTKNAPLWKEAQRPNRDVFDTWDAKFRTEDDQGGVAGGNGLSRRELRGAEFLLTAQQIRIHSRAPDPGQHDHGELPARRLAAHHRQYVVLVAGRSGPGGYLGQADLSGILSHRGRAGVPGACAWSTWEASRPRLALRELLPG